MKARHWAVLCLSLFFLDSLHAQNNSPQIAIEEFIQQLFQQQEIAMNYEDFYEAMFQLYAHPIDLNRATREELQALNILSQLQVSSFLDHRAKVGELLSKYELQVIPNFDMATIFKLVPFVSIRPMTKGLKNIIDPRDNEASTYFMLRASQTVQPARGYTESKFVGSPQQIYSRFRSAKSKNYSLGFTLEKDAGEKLWRNEGKGKGPDFYSFHAAIFNRNKLKSLIVGDYQLQFGQGLVLGAGFNFGKGAETIATVKRNNIGARPYTSVLEMAYFRGACVTYLVKPFLEISAFYSGKRIDGNLVAENTHSESDNVSSLVITGLHRTEAEIADKNAVGEKSMGGNMSFNNARRNFHLGYTAVNTYFDRSIQKSLYGYNVYEFTGHHNLVQSIDVSWYLQNVNLFGELAQSSSQGRAGTVGVLASLSSTVDVAMLYRNLGKNFHSFYARAFAENYRPINEEGVYWGIKVKPKKAWTIAAYYDYFKFPWLKFRTDAPSAGNEAMVRITWQPSKILVAYVQNRFLEKQRNYTQTSRPLYYPENYQRHHYLMDLVLKAGEAITLHGRVQGSSFQHMAPSTHGFYIMQEITYRKRSWSASARYALFDSDDYDNRQYVYEKDVLYAFSIPMLYGQGSRYYLLTHWRFSRHLDFWIKYSHTQYRNVETNGSGLDMIMGNAQSDIRVQMRWRL